MAEAVLDPKGTKEKEKNSDPVTPKAMLGDEEDDLFFLSRDDEMNRDRKPAAASAASKKKPEG